MLKRRQSPHFQWGYADFFDSREKKIILQIAEAGRGDVLYDLGCGDASFLIFALENYDIRRAIGYESMPQRIGLAKRNVRKQGLSDRIEIVSKDFNEKVDLAEATIILDMLPQGEDTVERYLPTIKSGTRIIRHDLPLIGFVPDRVIHPFYRHTFPFNKTRSSREWASSVLSRKNVTLEDVWHELFYYGNQKRYSKWVVRDYMGIAKNRFR